MKNYFKFIVTVAAITFATFGSIITASANGQAVIDSKGECSGSGICKVTSQGNTVDGNYCN